MRPIYSGDCQQLEFTNADWLALDFTSVLETKISVAPSTANAVAQASPMPIEAPVYISHGQCRCHYIKCEFCVPYQKHNFSVERHFDGFPETTYWN